jgi:hypothetical protein
MQLSRAAHELFVRQHGVASLSQLAQAGLSTRHVRRLVQEGALDSGLRGTYRSPSVPIDELSRCAEVCLARPDVVVAGPTAGRVWGFRRLPRDQRVHIIGHPASNASIARWVVPYRTAAIRDVDIVRRGDGIRVTSRARTAFDLTRWLTADDLLSVIEQAMHDGTLTEFDLWDVAADWVTPGRPWTRAFVRQLQRRSFGPPAESHPEVRVAIALADAGVTGLVRQYAIDLPGYGRARFDLALPDLAWAIEIDVHPRHDETLGRSSDAHRDKCAAALGWLTSRISRSDYLDRFDTSIRRLTEEFGVRRRDTRQHAS